MLMGRLWYTLIFIAARDVKIEWWVNPLCDGASSCFIKCVSLIIELCI